MNRQNAVRCILLLLCIPATISCAPSEQNSLSRQIDCLLNSVRTVKFLTPNHCPALEDVPNPEFAIVRDSVEPCLFHLLGDLNALPTYEQLLADQTCDVADRLAECDEAHADEAFVDEGTILGGEVLYFRIGGEPFGTSYFFDATTRRLAGSSSYGDFPDSCDCYGIAIIANFSLADAVVTRRLCTNQ